MSMASCGMGAPSISKLNFCRNRIGFSLAQYDTQIRAGPQSPQSATQAWSIQRRKGLTVCCGPDSKPLTSSEERDCSSRASNLIPNSFEVEYLLTEICNTSSVTDFELKLGGFSLHVVRDLAARNDKAAPSPFPETAVANTSETVSAHPLAISKPAASTEDGLAIIRSPRVGNFRRSQTIKGKRAPPACKEKQIVKEGQVLCYIEQLGGQLPIESDISGEVTKLLCEDGDPVGYGDAVVAILPSFPKI